MKINKIFRFVWIAGVAFLLLTSSVFAETGENAQQDKVNVLSSSQNPSFQLASNDSLYSFLYTLLPMEIWKQAVSMDRLYVKNPNTLYQEVLPYNDQYLYHLYTRTFEPFIARALVAKAKTLSVPSLYTSPQAFSSLEKDQYGLWTDIQTESLKGNAK